MRALERGPRRLEAIEPPKAVPSTPEPRPRLKNAPALHVPRDGERLVFEVTAKGKPVEITYEVGWMVARAFRDKGWLLDPIDMEGVRPDGSRFGLLGQDAYVQETGEPLPKGGYYDAERLTAAVPACTMLLTWDEQAERCLYGKSSRATIEDLTGKVRYFRARERWMQPIAPELLEALAPRWDAIQSEYQALLSQEARCATDAALQERWTRAWSALAEAQMGPSQTLLGKKTLSVVDPEDARAWWLAIDAEAKARAKAGVPLDEAWLNSINGRYRTGGEEPGGLRVRSVYNSRSTDGIQEYVSTDFLRDAMDQFWSWYGGEAQSQHPVLAASRIYQELVSLHPWPDADGRTARRAMDSELMRRGFPPAVFGEEHVGPAVWAETRLERSVSPAAALTELTEALERSVGVLREHLAQP